MKVKVRHSGTKSGTSGGIEETNMGKIHNKLEYNVFMKPINGYMAKNVLYRDLRKTSQGRKLKLSLET